MDSSCEPCTCVIPEGSRLGWCEKHQCKKTAHWVMLCQTRPEYRDLWNRSVGPGQLKPALSESPPSPPPAGGAGTELKLVLKRFWIVAQPNCKCEQRAREMDANGIAWCEEHIGEITDWLETEAKSRHLPFVRLAAVVLIRRAIKNAKRKEQAK